MAWEYAAVVRINLRHKISKLGYEYWALYNGDLTAYRVYGDQSTVHQLRINIVDENLDEIWNSIMEIKKGTKERTHENQIDDLDKELKKEFSRLVNQIPCIIPRCHFVAIDSLKLVNLAGGYGWETTGQVPGYPGPTGITMMRKRIE